MYFGVLHAPHRLRPTSALIHKHNRYNYLPSTSFAKFHHRTTQTQFTSSKICTSCKFDFKYQSQEKLLFLSHILLRSCKHERSQINCVKKVTTTTTNWVILDCADVSSLSTTSFCRGEKHT